MNKHTYPHITSTIIPKTQKKQMKSGKEALIFLIMIPLVSDMLNLNVC